jgi:hypothetical protein
MSAEATDSPTAQRSPMIVTARIGTRMSISPPPYPNRFVRMPANPKNDSDTMAAEMSVMGSPSKDLGGLASSTRERTPEKMTIARKNPSPHPSAVRTASRKAEAVGNVVERDAQHAAVRRNERQVDAERLVQARHVLFEHDLDELHERRDDEDEDDRLHVGEIDAPVEQQMIDRPRDRGGQDLHEDDGEAHAGGLVQLSWTRRGTGRCRGI